MLSFSRRLTFKTFCLLFDAQCFKSDFFSFLKSSASLGILVYLKKSHQTLRRLYLAVIRHYTAKICLQHSRLSVFLLKNNESVMKITAGIVVLIIKYDVRRSKLFRTIPNFRIFSVKFSVR